MTDVMAVLGRMVADAERWTTVSAGESGASVLRSPDGSTFAKVVAAAQGAVLAGERDRIAWLSGTGIGAPSVLDWLEDDDGACLVTSAVTGVPADRLGVDDLAAAWPRIAEAARDLHELPPDECPFSRDLATMMARARDVVAAGGVVPEFLPAELRDVPAPVVLERLESQYEARIADETAETVVCHGDLCLPNVLVDPDGGEVTGFVDLGRLGRADPYADIALLLANARETWPDEDVARGADAVFATRYGTTLDPDRRRYYLWLDPLTWSG